MKFLPYNFISVGASLLVTIEGHVSVLHLRICQQRENINPHVFLRCVRKVQKRRRKANWMLVHCSTVVIKMFLKLSSFLLPIFAFISLFLKSVRRKAYIWMKRTWDWWNQSLYTRIPFLFTPFSLRPQASHSVTYMGRLKPSSISTFTF